MEEKKKKGITININDSRMGKNVKKAAEIQSKISDVVGLVDASKFQSTISKLTAPVAGSDFHNLIPSNVLESVSNFEFYNSSLALDKLGKKALELVNLEGSISKDLIKTIKAANNFSYKSLLNITIPVQPYDFLNAPYLEDNKMLLEQLTNFASTAKMAFWDANVNPFVELKDDIISNLQSLPDNIVEYKSDNEIICGDKTFHQKDIQNFIHSNLPDATEYDTRTLVNAINKNTDAIKKLNDPLWKKVLLTIILQFIVSICLIYITPYLKQNIDLPAEKKVVQTVVTNIPSNVRKILKRDYRLVTASKLNVRERSSRKSKIKGTLDRWDLVKVVIKNRNWTFIEWYDEEGECQVKGWVFTRYLMKIK